MVRLIQIWPGWGLAASSWNLQADFLGAGEGDKARLGMLDQGVAEAAAAAGDEVDHAIGRAAGFQGLEELRRDGHGVAAGLEDDGVAADDRGHGHAGEDGQGEIPRRNDGAHAEREVAQLAALAGPLHGRCGLGEAQRLAGVELDEVDGFGHFGVGLGEVLADLEDQPGRPLEFVVAQGAGHAEQEIGALVDRVSFQLSKALSAASMAAGTSSASAFWKMPTSWRGIRGVDRLQLGGGALAMAADDVVILAAELAAHSFNGGAHLAGGVFVAEIVEGFVHEGALMGWGARPDGEF